MSKSYLHIFFIAILFLTFFGCGKTYLILTDGNLNFLKGQNSINVEYQYDNLMVGEMTEEAYINEKVEDKNADEPGKGDKWVKQWFADREERFQPKFEELLNDNIEGKAVFGSGLVDTKYTLIFKTTSIEPGYNFFISRKDADIDGVALFVETDNPQNVLAAFSIKNCPGGGASGFDFDVAYRVQEAYALAGKRLASHIINYL